MRQLCDVGGWTRRGVARAALLGVLLCASCVDPDPSEVGRSSAEIEVGPEVDVEPPAPVLAAGAQVRVQALRAGDHYLVAWTDRRADWPAAGPITGDLFGARVASDGTVLDPVGFPIAARGPAQVQETVSGACSDGGVCLFVTGASFGAGPVQGIRVVDDQVLDATPLLIAEGAIGGDVAWDGARFRVVWSQGGESRSSTVTVDGVVGAPVAVGLGTTIEDRIECAGARCLVIGVATDDQNFRMVGRLLELQGPVGAPFLISNPEGSPSSGDVFWDGARYWISVLEYSPTDQANHRLYLVRVSANGAVLDPAGIDLSPAAVLTSLSGGSIGPSRRRGSS